MRILEPAAIGCDAGEYDSDSDWSPADEFEGLDDVSLPIASDNVPRSIPCQKPVGNVIIQDGPMPEPSRGGSKQYQSPLTSFTRFCITTDVKADSDRVFDDDARAIEGD